MFRNILIATDGRAMSWQAIAHGVGLAEQLGARVTAVTVTPPHEPGACWPWLTSSGQGVCTSTIEEMASWYLAAVSSAAVAAGVPCATVEVMDANVSRGLLESAKTHGCDLIVMGTPIRSGFDLALLGSVTRDVITSGSLPVLVCRPPADPVEGTTQPTTRVAGFRHILIATDGSEIAAHGVAAGLDLALALSAAVTAVTVTPPWHSVGGHDVLWDKGQTYEARVALEAAEHLAAAEAEAVARGVPFSGLHVRHANAHAGLLEPAAARGCDLVVMTTHGRSGLRAMLLGSVTTNVLAHSALPILVCH